MVLFINTRALQLHMLALHTHAHVSLFLLQVAAGVTGGTGQLYATIRTLFRACACRVTGLELLTIWIALHLH